MGAKSTRKGANGEREVMAILRDHGYPVGRGGTQSFGELPDLYGFDGVHLEIKRAERAQIWEWMQQSQRDAQKFGDGVPSVIFRRNRSEWLICLELNDFLRFYKRHECRCGGHCDHQKAEEIGEKRKGDRDDVLPEKREKEAVH